MPDSVLQDILVHVNAETSGIAFVGGYLHESPDTLVAVMNPETGLENIATMGVSIGTIGIERPIVQIRSRGSQNGFLVANDNAWIVYRAIHNTINATINGTLYLMIEATQTPYTLGADENGRWIVGFNLQIYKEANA